MPKSAVHRGVKIEKRGQRWRWRARIDRVVISRSADTYEEARDLLDRYLDDRARKAVRAEAAVRNPVSIAELCDGWFLDKSSRLAPSTSAQYTIHIRVHIKAGIGQSDANAIRPKDLSAFYASLRWKSAKESHNILRQAFEWGLANQVLSRESNPCLVVRPSRRTSTDHDGTFDYDGRIQPINEKQIPTRLELEKLLIDAETTHNPRWWPI